MEVEPNMEVNGVFEDYAKPCIVPYPATLELKALTNTHPDFVASGGRSSSLVRTQVVWEQASDEVTMTM